MATRTHVLTTNSINLKNVGANSQDVYFGDDSGIRTIISDYFHSLTLYHNLDLW